jgi:hypothetical protein
LRDQSNAVVFNYPYSLQASKFDGTLRSTDFTFSFPHEALRTGPYLLTFEARKGTHTAVRQVRFTFH